MHFYEDDEEFKTSFVVIILGITFPAKPRAFRTGGTKASFSLGSQRIGRSPKGSCHAGHLGFSIPIFFAWNNYNPGNICYAYSNLNSIC